MQVVIVNMVKKMASKFTPTDFAMASIKQ